MCSPVTWPRVAAEAALAVDTTAAVPAAVTGLGDFRWPPGDIRRVGLSHAASNSINGSSRLGVALVVADWAFRGGQPSFRV